MDEKGCKCRRLDSDSSLGGYRSISVPLQLMPGSNYKIVILTRTSLLRLSVECKATSEDTRERMHVGEAPALPHTLKWMLIVERLVHPQPFGLWEGA
jgi:hypothetical protein